MAEASFTKSEKDRIMAAIKEAELHTSGEIRVHIENTCKKEVLDRAVEVFDMLHMQKTQLRNGVLFYLAIKDHKFAILGDAGINKVVPENFWDQIKETCIGHFRQGQFAEGLVMGIGMAGQQLKAHFPYQSDDVNELSDDISFQSN